MKSPSTSERTQGSARTVDNPIVGSEQTWLVEFIARFGGVAHNIVEQHTRQKLVECGVGVLHVIFVSCLRSSNGGDLRPDLGF